MLDLTQEINEMVNERRMTEEKVQSLISDMLKSAYKRKFGTDENVSIRFIEENGSKCVEVLAVKEVVAEENWYDAVKQIALDDAKELGGEEVEVGDVLEIPLNPRDFEYSAVQSAKQRSQQVVKEYNNDKTYVDAKAMEGSLVRGEIKRANQDGSYMVNIGLEGTDALFSLRGQSPRETYDIQEKLKFYVEKVDRGDDIVERGGRDGRMQKKSRGVRVLLSRSSKEFVKALLESEVPEIANGDVEIKAIARHAGIRTKVAVDTKKTDLDPVGTTVGKQGLRIQTIMNECEGEKIDVIRYENDPLVFIVNALIPAQVKRVVTIDPNTKHVVAIVDENQQGIAIGQGGVNVKLAKMLCDWNIEVKTEAQFKEMEETQKIYEGVDNLFKPEEEEVKEESHQLTNEEIGIAEDETPITELDLSADLITKLHDADIWSVEEFFDYSDAELKEKGFSEDEIDAVKNSVEFDEGEEETEFECPVCHTVLAAGTTVCPNCGAEFEFE